MVDLTTIKEEKSTNFMAQQNLFVGSLSYTTTDESLKAHFEQIGEVEDARVVRERDNADPSRPGRSKGFGFVTYVNEDDNQKAVDELDGKDLDGRPINVSLARPKEDRPRRDFNGGGGNRDSRSGGGGGSFRQRSW
jgi:RNA recognition motif-containing protein